MTAVCGRTVPAGQAHYDHDPEALAWARAHVQRIVDLHRTGKNKKNLSAVFVAAALERYLISGGVDALGPIIGAFDARKPDLSEQVAAREAAS